MLLSHYPRLNGGVRGVFVRLTVGALSGVLAVFVRHVMAVMGSPPNVLPLAIGFPAMLVIGIAAGRLAGITSMLVSGFGTWFFIIAPKMSFGGGFPVAAAVSGYFIIGLMILWIVEAYRQSEARRAAEHNAHLEAQRRQQELLTQELNHRLKNVLTMVQGVAAQTFMHTDQPALDVFNARMQAIANAQALFHGVHRKDADLRDVVDTAVRPFSGKGKIRFEGESCTIADKQALWLSLALHELGTNATKYGALSNRVGEVVIATKPTGDDFSLCWSETAGPKVNEPARKGFGSKLLKQARAELEFRPEGIHCEIPNIRCVAA
jgi:two-component sensor histidine kinase